MDSNDEAGDVRRALRAAGVTRLKAQIAELRDRMDRDRANGRGYAREDLSRMEDLKGWLKAEKRGR